MHQKGTKENREAFKTDFTFDLFAHGKGGTSISKSSTNSNIIPNKDINTQFCCRPATPEEGLTNSKGFVFTSVQKCDMPADSSTATDTSAISNLRIHVSTDWETKCHHWRSLYEELFKSVEASATSNIKPTNLGIVAIPHGAASNHDFLHSKSNSTSLSHQLQQAQWQAAEMRHEAELLKKEALDIRKGSIWMKQEISDLESSLRRSKAEVDDIKAELKLWKSEVLRLAKRLASNDETLVSVCPLLSQASLPISSVPSNIDIYIPRNMNAANILPVSTDNILPVSKTSSIERTYIAANLIPDAKTNGSAVGLVLENHLQTSEVVVIPRFMPFEAMDFAKSSPLRKTGSASVKTSLHH
jgi:hypothetical protein